MRHDSDFDRQCRDTLHKGCHVIPFLKAYKMYFPVNAKASLSFFPCQFKTNLKLEFDLYNFYIRHFELALQVT